jgi:hypothetical protein
MPPNCHGASLASAFEMPRYRACPERSRGACPEQSRGAWLLLLNLAPVATIGGLLATAAGTLGGAISGNFKMITFGYRSAGPATPTGLRVLGS